jgi:3-mercaptopyruvate sulfurtransferase SseA
VFRRHLADPGGLAPALGSAGVNPAHEAVIASGGGLTKDAALAFLLLEKLGQQRVSILMETTEAWAARGFPVAKDATLVGTPASPREISVRPATYTPALRYGGLLAEPTRTQGVYPKVWVASGEQLPSKGPEGQVVHVPYTSLLNADGTPKAAKDVWKTLAKAGVTRYGEFVLVADDPAEAAVNYVIFRLMGFPDVKVLAR